MTEFWKVKQSQVRRLRLIFECKVETDRGTQTWMNDMRMMDEKNQIYYRQIRDSGMGRQNEDMYSSDNSSYRLYHACSQVGYDSGWGWWTSSNQSDLDRLQKFYRDKVVAD